MKWLYFNVCLPPKKRHVESSCNVNSHPLNCMLQVWVLVYRTWLFKAGHTWISFGDKRNTKKIVSKTSDIVLLRKFKFSEWDQDGMAWNMAEGNKRNMVKVYVSESSSEEGPMPYFLVYSSLNISTYVHTHWRKQMENFCVSSLESLLSHTFFCYVIMSTFASIHCWKWILLWLNQTRKRTEWNSACYWRQDCPQSSLLWTCKHHSLPILVLLCPFTHMPNFYPVPARGQYCHMGREVSLPSRA